MTQITWVKGMLRETGEITRNQCLANYISRLSAIIQDLENEGYSFTTSRRNGDYVYTLAMAPKRPVSTFESVIRDGRQVAVREVISMV